MGLVVTGVQNGSRFGLCRIISKLSYDDLHLFEYRHENIKQFTSNELRTKRWT